MHLDAAEHGGTIDAVGRYHRTPRAVWGNWTNGLL